MKTRIMVTIVILLAAAFSFGATLEQGPEHIDINTGGKGHVPFPHREHQKNLKDCNICHQYFPQRKDSILTLKNEGKLKKKQIMTELCLNCHKALMKAGKEHGPTSCSQCHTKR